MAAEMRADSRQPASERPKGSFYHEQTFEVADLDDRLWVERGSPISRRHRPTCGHSEALVCFPEADSCSSNPTYGFKHSSIRAGRRGMADSARAAFGYQMAFGCHSHSPLVNETEHASDRDPLRRWNNEEIRLNRSSALVEFKPVRPLSSGAESACAGFVWAESAFSAEMDYQANRLPRLRGRFPVVSRCFDERARAGRIEHAYPASIPVTIPGARIFRRPRSFVFAMKVGAVQGLPALRSKTTTSISARRASGNPVDEQAAHLVGGLRGKAIGMRLQPSVGRRRQVPEPQHAIDAALLGSPIDQILDVELPDRGIPDLRVPLALHFDRQLHRSRAKARSARLVLGISASVMR